MARKNLTFLVTGLLAIIVIAGAWWILNGQPSGPAEVVCGPDLSEAGEKYSLAYCDTSCNTDNDCRFACGCGPINKYEMCGDESYNCEEVSLVKCEAGSCVAAEETPEPTCRQLLEVLQSELEEANYCSTDSDCKSIELPGAIAEVSCFRYLNKAVDEDRLLGKIEEYTSSCYLTFESCGLSPSVGCVSGKCLYLRS